MSAPLLPGEAAAGAYPISAVERETGLSKDTLRMWERRYGFPAPGRDAQGERVYPACTSMRNTASRVSWASAPSASTAQICVLMSFMAKTFR